MFNKIIGNTPIVKIAPNIYAKLETYSPSGSIKDRMVAYVVQKAVISGEIHRESRFVEATSGNTGIALAMLGAAMGKEVHIIMPCNMSSERLSMMKAFGANIHTVGPSDFQAAIEKRDQMLKQDKSWWSPMQFSNPLNIEAHYETTALEIYNDVKGELNKDWCAFVAGAGTGGTMMGVLNFINDRSLKTKTVLMVPEESSSEHGIQGVNDGADFLLDKSRVSSVVQVSTEEAKERAKRLAKENGLLVGISSGANLVAAERWADQNDVSGAIVTILCDRGERYLT